MTEYRGRAGDIVTHVRVHEQGKHAIIHVYGSGGEFGRLLVPAEYAHEIAMRLIGSAETKA